eukprot:CAMPEP_0197836422 /NCGR_PEP_ID=MMETSP1437-20131217/28928_1 /TAXON_ID=49252 ORGANISM="Eucampia antarctica, Strain CCMP1452" /NCGR_SAMPLE_ID=MMETSP1437 /ASSEMBLY_ACC=CAM_ASM_001096 /LENGTH=233 /DNA_ID=CAMNT_0043442587 /DNA_START=96 /DNA_END=797 /DNA_ORIENTATION=-
MSFSYEDYESNYNSNLLKVRSFLASTRSTSSLRECDRLLSEARRAAVSMQGLAEVEGNAFKIEESKSRIQREVMPLLQEVDNALKQKQSGGMMDASNFHNSTENRNELFSGYRAPPMGAFDSQQQQNGNSNSDLESLIQSSENMLLESQSLCVESEQIGNNTLLTMQVQRDQLNNASHQLKSTTEKIGAAGSILKDMGRKALRNKLCLYSIIAFLIAMNIFAIKAVIKKRSSN